MNYYSKNIIYTLPFKSLGLVCFFLKKLILIIFLLISTYLINYIFNQCLWRDNFLVPIDFHTFFSSILWKSMETFFIISFFVFNKERNSGLKQIEGVNFYFFEWIILLTDKNISKDFTKKKIKKKLYIYYIKMVLLNFPFIKRIIENIISKKFPKNLTLFNIGNNKKCFLSSILDCNGWWKFWFVITGIKVNIKKILK